MIEFGHHADGSPAMVDGERSLLVSGGTGSGASRVVHRVIEALDPENVVLIDTALQGAEYRDHGVRIIGNVGIAAAWMRHLLIRHPEEHTVVIVEEFASLTERTSEDRIEEVARRAVLDSVSRTLRGEIENVSVILVSHLPFARSIISSAAARIILGSSDPDDGDDLAIADGSDIDPSLLIPRGDAVYVEDGISRLVHVSEEV